jgi:hypothetical protein
LAVSLDHYKIFLKRLMRGFGRSLKSLPVLRLSDHSLPLDVSSMPSISALVRCFFKMVSWSHTG